MKIKYNYEWVHNLVFLSISIATARHSAWSYSTTMEGPQPVVDWAAFNLNMAGLWLIGGLAMWFTFGLLAAIAVDVSMFALSKNIRESAAEGKSNLGMYLTYLMVAFFSAYFQVMFALNHAADFQPVESVPVWVNAAYVWRFLIVPISLPVISIGYTFFFKLDESRNKPVLGKLDEKTGQKTYTADEVAAKTGFSATRIRQYVYEWEKDHSKPQIGARDKTGKMYFTDEDLELIGVKK